MSKPVYIDDAIKNAQHEERHFFDEPEERWFHAGEKVALHRVRSGEIVTDADLKVDELYRALAGMSALLDQVLGDYTIESHEEFEGWTATMRLTEVRECIEQEVMTGEECPVCTMGIHSLDDRMVGALNVASEAVEYVNNNPKEDR